VSEGGQGGGKMYRKPGNTTVTLDCPLSPR